MNEKSKGHMAASSLEARRSQAGHGPHRPRPPGPRSRTGSGTETELAPLMRELGRLVREATHRVEGGRPLEAISSMMAVPALHANIVELLSVAIDKTGQEAPGVGEGSERLIGQYL